MLTLFINPFQANYSGQLPGALTSILQGPSSNYRKDYERSPFEVTVNWVVDGYGFQYLRSFYRGGVQRGSMPFLVELIIDQGTPQIYTAFFVPGTFKLVSVDAEKFVCSANLEVGCIEIDDAADLTAFAAFQAARGA